MLDMLKENKDFIITIGIHIFMPIVYFCIFISFLFALLYSLTWAVGDDFDNPEINLKILVFIIICLVYFALFVLRICILPYWYSIIEEKSKSIKLKKNINNLKHNIWYRLALVIVLELPFILILICLTHNTIPKYKDLLSLFFTIPFVCDLLGCYVVLFLWWDLQKLIKKHKEKVWKLAKQV
ncbi:hypothetical protein IJ579_05710 [bacterium]|nr:hypothetical protein [bacterium]